MLREKSRESSVSWVSSWAFWTDGEPPDSTGSSTKTAISDKEVITYQTGKNRTSFRPCHHKHYVFSASGGSTSLNFDVINTPSRHGRIIGIPHEGLSQVGLENLMRTYNPVPSLDAFCSRAVRAMTPSMGTGFSGANFLLELKELPGLWKWAKSHVLSLMTPRLKKQNLKEVFDDFSNESLNYSFGIKPLISDIKSLYEGLTSFNQRLSNLQRDARKPQLRHYTEISPASNTAIEQSATNGTDYLQCSFKPTKLVATMQFSYDLPDLTELQRKIYGALDSLGLDINAQVIWNAIPFSFVVDWFFNISDFLEQFNTRWIEPIVHIDSFGYSVKQGISVRQRYTRSAWWSGYHNYYQTNPLASGHSASLDTYSRMATVPSPHWFSVENTGVLNGRKVFLGSLLIQQRLR